MTSAAAGAAGRAQGGMGVGADARMGMAATKASFKTTELFVYLAAVLAVVITAWVVGGDGTSPDPFGAEQALRLITFLTIGYMLSRGLAKAGSREPVSEGR